MENEQWGRISASMGIDKRAYFRRKWKEFRKQRKQNRAIKFKDFLKTVYGYEPKGKKDGE